MRIEFGKPTELLVNLQHKQHKFIGKPVAKNSLGVVYENCDKDVLLFDKILVDEENNVVSGSFFRDENDIDAGYVKYIWDKFGFLKKVITEKTRDKIKITEHMNLLSSNPYMTTVTDFNGERPIKIFMDEFGNEFKKELK